MGPVLISNGAEQVVQYQLCDDFVVTAEYDGVVREINEKAGVIVVEYTSKDASEKNKFKAINISKTIDKNGAGGFFISNQLHHELKEGQKFKKDDILAYDPKFFKDTLFGNKYAIGTLLKVACMSDYSTFEDSAPITHKLSEEMATEVCFEIPVVLGKNANVDKMLKVGTEVKSGDELLSFEESFEEETLNKLLGNIGEELKEEIKNEGKKPIKTKYSGVIEDIQVYSGSELEELSPSLQKIVKSYWNEVSSKSKILNKYDKDNPVLKCGMLLNQPTHKMETKDGKIKGNRVDDGVLIIFYVKCKNYVNIGDKITFFTALKSTIGHVIPEGYEPYTLDKPDEEISSFVAPAAVLARMTPSILISMLANKCMVELKNQLRDIYES